MDIYNDNGGLELPKYEIGGIHVGTIPASELKIGDIFTMGPINDGHYIGTLPSGENGLREIREIKHGIVKRVIKDTKYGDLVKVLVYEDDATVWIVMLNGGETVMVVGGMYERIVRMTSEGLGDRLVRTKLTNQDLAFFLDAHNKMIEEYENAGTDEEIDEFYRKYQYEEGAEVEYDLVDFLIGQGLVEVIEFDENNTFCMDGGDGYAYR